MLDNPVRSGTPFWVRTKRLAQRVFDVLSPPICVSCRKPGHSLCENCIADLNWLAQPICTTCGRPLSHSAEKCWFCHRRTPLLTQIRAAVVFEKPITSAIYALKYKSQFGLATPLGDILTTAWAQWQTDADIIIPIPLSDERQRQRGYNQSELIAERFAKDVNRPMVAAALVRVKHTKPQVGLNMDERLLNVDQAFIADRNLVAGKRVLLIDDVCTTGATLTAAAIALLQADASIVSAYCVARAVTDRYKS